MSSPTIVRRTTLVVRDIHKSVAFYRDALDLSVYYDSELELSGVTMPIASAGAKCHLVILQAEDPWIGMLGLMQVTDPEEPDPGPYRQRLSIGDVAFVMQSADARAVFEKVRASGVQLIQEPIESAVPKPGGGEIRMITSSFFDPDGFFIEVNQRLSS
jgi:catechol 2,3-dioxygenase-like lactoylglutathione lyase family enzyme